MKFPEKLDVLTVQARLIAETGEPLDSAMKAYLNQLLLPLKTVIATKLPIS